MQEEDLHLKLMKCAFDQASVEYLGLVIKNGEVHMDPTKLAKYMTFDDLIWISLIRSGVLLILTPS